ncbi:hypothetical protein [Evansella cellulosilytica]|uniref:Uncharacterized protein n=1 Tax=Evansella cellulosilytica (strain ATCC 21833 / DSM 2522 / FERM P-1141 / JCM 9156 / N-4) TaxID=649639 RepID=E6TWE4_EVAC2|nr:hypothetical protein [Evansella cellulosilytica]ADU32207.1 hypothetical protein Bcell_3974 [Evansella cellulosilytica DSM 2522]
MFKSVKGQFIITIITAVLFVFHIFVNVTELSGFIDILFYFIMIIAVYNAGLLTQKYIQTNKAKKK